MRKKGQITSNNVEDRKGEKSRERVERKSQWEREKGRKYKVESE